MKIYLSNGMVAQISSKDAHLLDGWKIYPTKGRHVWYGQACRWDGRRQIKTLLHRLIMRPPPGVIVCHLNGDGLDCRRSNMRIGSHAKNGSSVRTKNRGASSRFRGVHINNGRGRRWTVMFWDAGKCIYLGRYDDEVVAAKAYDVEAKKRFGEFSHLNFP